METLILVAGNLLGWWMVFSGFGSQYVCLKMWHPGTSCRRFGISLVVVMIKDRIICSKNWLTVIIS